MSERFSVNKAWVCVLSIRVLSEIQEQAVVRLQAKKMLKASVLQEKKPAACRVGEYQGADPAVANLRSIGYQHF